MAFQFKDRYLEYVKKKVANIKAQNQGKSKEELIKICSRKGGTLISSTIASIFVIVYFVIIIDQYLLNGNIGSKFKISTNKTDKLGELSYTIPSNLSTSTQLDEDTKTYSTAHNSHDYCSFSVEKEEATSYNSDVKQYLLKNIHENYDDNTVSEKKINGNTWYYKTFTGDFNQTYYYYSTLYNGKLYRIEFSMSSLDNYNKTCVSVYNTFKDSLKFK